MEAAAVATAVVEEAAAEATAEKLAAAAMGTIAVAPSAFSCATIFLCALERLCHSPSAPLWITNRRQRLLGSKSDLYSKLVRVPLVVVVEGRGREQLLPESGSARELRSIVARHRSWWPELVAGEPSLSSCFEESAPFGSP